ncbi:MAG: sel1 repeat family protein [Phycisphaerales bacterium]|nr:sel1 repeat family protein [Phycisphaerales bacterium]
MEKGVRVEFAVCVLALMLTAAMGWGDASQYMKGAERGDAEAAEWSRKAAEQGNVKAQYNLGAFYENGVGVSADVREAVRWYQKAADQGHAGAREALKRLEGK